MIIKYYNIELRNLLIKNMYSLDNKKEKESSGALLKVFQLENDFNIIKIFIF